VHRALDAAGLLAEGGISAAVVNMACVRPIDRDAIVRAARRGPIVTAEEHTVVGGLGSAVAEVVVETCPVRMKMLGVPGVFAPTGSSDFLLEHFGLTAAGIAAAARALLHRNERAAASESRERPAFADAPSGAATAGPPEPRAKRVSGAGGSDRGVPASERVGGSAGAKPPG
jgi:hypothetical protein